MSLSRNFPARAEPSYEGSEPSRAKLGHFNFRAETELTKFQVLIKNHDQISQLWACIIIIINIMIIFMNLCKQVYIIHNLLQILTLESLVMKWGLGFSKNVSARQLKCPSSARLGSEPSQLGSARAGKFQLGLITTKYIQFSIATFIPESRVPVNSIN